MKCSGVGRLKANANRLPILTLFLVNVHSLDNKLDLLWVWMSVSDKMRNCSIHCLKETWLKDNTPALAFQIWPTVEPAYIFLADHNLLSGTATGGSLCFDIKKGWCTKCVMINSHCSKDLERNTVKCHPFFLPHQFSAMLVIAAYIAPYANAEELHNIQLTSEQAPGTIVHGGWEF